MAAQFRTISIKEVASRRGVFKVRVTYWFGDKDVTFTSEELDTRAAEFPEYPNKVHLFIQTVANFVENSALNDVNIVEL